MYHSNSLLSLNAWLSPAIKALHPNWGENLFSEMRPHLVAASQGKADPEVVCKASSHWSKKRSRASKYEFAYITVLLVLCSLALSQENN